MGPGSQGDTQTHTHIRNNFDCDAIIACDTSRRLLMLFVCMCPCAMSPLTTKANTSRFLIFRLRETQNTAVCIAHLAHLRICVYRLRSINIYFCIIKEIPHSHWLCLSHTLHSTHQHQPCSAQISDHSQKAEN